MGFFGSLKAKFKDMKKSPRERARELYSSKSLRELIEMIGNGLEKRNEPCKTVDEKFGLADAYLEKLACSEVSEGGFGFHDVALLREITAEGSHFAGSIYEFGTYQRTSKVVGTIIQNYRLEFLKNYLHAGNTKKFRSDWFLVLFKYPDSTRDEEEDGFTTDGINICLDRDDLTNPDCAIYNPWVYRGDDDWILYKLKSVVAFSDWNFAAKYRCYKNADRMQGFLDSEDLINSGCNTKQELQQFIDDCQVDD